VASGITHSTQTGANNVVRGMSVGLPRKVQSTTLSAALRPLIGWPDGAPKRDTNTPAQICELSDLYGIAVLVIDLGEVLTFAAPQLRSSVRS